jgi:hypothetical protein
MDDDEKLKHEGDETVGDEGDPGPTGSSTGVHAPRPNEESPEARSEKERDHKERRRIKT